MGTVTHLKDNWRKILISLLVSRTNVDDVYLPSPGCPRTKSSICDRVFLIFPHSSRVSRTRVWNMCQKRVASESLPVGPTQRPLPTIIRNITGDPCSISLKSRLCILSSPDLFPSPRAPWSSQTRDFAFADAHRINSYSHGRIETIIIVPRSPLWKASNVLLDEQHAPAHALWSFSFTLQHMYMLE